MCTSFISQKDGSMIGMNFDNNGMKYKISTVKKGWFIVYVDTGKIKVPSFGVREDGAFFNNLCVDSNGKGDYKRGKGPMHTTKFLTDIIENKIELDKLNDFFRETRIVNVPNWSTHNMICDSHQNVWMIEPGRGIIYYKASDYKYCIMTNESVWDVLNEGKTIECPRYQLAEKLLEENKRVTVDKAFQILDCVKQSEGEWITDFSMVFHKKEKKVYYGEKQDFKQIKEYSFL